MPVMARVTRRYLGRARDAHCAARASHSPFSVWAAQTGPGKQNRRGAFWAELGDWGLSEGLPVLAWCGGWGLITLCHRVTERGKKYLGRAGEAS